MAAERKEQADKQRRDMKKASQAALDLCDLPVIRSLWDSGKYEEVGRREIALDAAHKASRETPTTSRRLMTGATREVAILLSMSMRTDVRGGVKFMIELARKGRNSNVLPGTVIEAILLQ